MSRSARSRTISSAKNGLPAARSVTVAEICATDESEPSSSASTHSTCGRIEWHKGYRLSIAHPGQHAVVLGAEVMSTIDCDCGITVRKSASIDSLTSSIQCTSSMT